MAEQSIAQQLASDPDFAELIADMSPGDRAIILEKAAAATARVAGGGPVSGQVTPKVSKGPTGQRFKLWNNYYSVVRFQAEVDVVGAVTTLTFPVQELRPFSYRINDVLTSAGFDASFGNATDCETNLVKAGETVGGEQLYIDGISCMPSSQTDIGLWLLLAANISTKISMDGDAHQYRLGRLDMIPGSGGTFGAGPTVTEVPDLASSLSSQSSFNNGWPTIDNFYPFPQPMLWTPGGETDSNFNVVLKLVRQQVVVLTARAASGTAVAAFTPPTDVGQFGTFVDVMVRLHSEQTAARSVNQ